MLAAGGSRPRNQTQRVPPPFTGPKAEVGNEIQKLAKHSVARQYLINQL
jgi:hypothetical protein